MSEYPNINEKAAGDSGYVAYFAGSGKPKVGVYAASAYAALELARAHYKPAKAKRYMVDVQFVEDSNGNVVPVSTAQF